MKHVLGLLLFLWIACGKSLSEDFLQDQSAIIHGRKCLEFEFPSSIEIWADALIDMAPLGIKHVSSMICGGTLIKPHVILTAAHCLRENNLTQGMGKLLKIRYGVVSNLDLKIFKQQERIPPGIVWAIRWTQHEAYSAAHIKVTGPGKDNDIGLLFLSKPLLVAPVAWLKPSDQTTLSVGMPVVIVGWGQQAIDADLQNPNTLAYKMCAQSMIHELGDFEMQIGSDEQSVRKCYGDSGGASYLQLPTGEYRLIGLTSHSYGKKECAEGGIDTRVDAYDDWIQAQLTMI